MFVHLLTAGVCRHIQFVHARDPAAVCEQWEREETAKEADRWAALPAFREVLVGVFSCFAMGEYGERE